MGAKYFMGTREGKAKGTGNPYWVFQVLRFNRFSSYELTQIFINRQDYSNINSMMIPLGAPVVYSRDDDGVLLDFQPDPTYVSLSLEQKSSNLVTPAVSASDNKPLYAKK